MTLPDLMKQPFKKYCRMTVVLPVLFCLLLAWFYFGSSWYPQATLRVSGTVADPQSTITIRFDSGSGFNRYELEKYPLELLPAVANVDGIPVTITRVGERNSASLGKKVVLRNILVDREKYLPDGRDLPPGVELQNGSLRFKEDGAVLALILKPEKSLEFEFPVANTMGMVDVRIGEKEVRKDLYSSNDERQWGGRYARFVQSWFVTEDGKFSVAMPMPRYGIRTLRVECGSTFSLSSVEIVTTDGEKFQLEASGASNAFEFRMKKLSRQLERHFHPHRLAFQVLFALLSAWVLARLFLFASRFHGVKDIFFQEQRYLFWAMLLFCCLSFSFWHIAFWPGVTSNDSLEIWRAAQIPGMYLGDHPPLNVIFYLYLSQFWNDVAIVPIIQNLLTALLISYIFFSLFRKGLPLFCLIPCYALVALSVPVGLYTIVLWKDVPFALIVVFVGYKLAAFSLERRRKTLRISKHEWFALACLVLALAGFRHNGVLYLLVVPLLLLLFGILKIRPLAMGIILSIAIFFCTVFFFLPGSSKTSGFLASQTRVYLSQAMDKLSIDYLEKCGKNYFGIFNVNQKNMQWDLVHLCMYGRYQIDAIKSLRWNDVYPYIPLPSNKIKKKIQAAAWAVYWKSLRSSWVYFSWNPVYILPFFLLLPLLFRQLPMASLFSLHIFVSMAVLIFLNIMNWRYYYFAHLASYFLLPLVLTDLFSRPKKDESYS